EHEPNPTRVWSETTNYLLYDMLRDVTTQGTGRASSQFLNFNADLASKTGTTNETVDVWYAGVTPGVSLVTWMGYDNQKLSLQNFGGLTPAQRNIRNWSNIMNVVYNLKPDLLKVNDRMNPPDDNSIVSQSVLASTGMKPGKVSLPNNRTTQISGSTKTEIFDRDNVPGTTIFDFSIGAKPSELNDFWNKQSNSQKKDSKKKEKKKKEKEKKEEDKKKEEEKKKEPEDDKKEENKESESNSEEEKKPDDSDNKEEEENS